MIVLIDGAAGSGKTWLMSRLIKKQWKKGERIFPNFPLWYDEERSNIFRWFSLDETYHLRKGIIVIDESAIILDARKWASLPFSFTEKLAMHRHHFLDIYTTTQDFGHIDIRIRSNVHERYNCNTIIRFPKNQKRRPILHIIRTTKKVRAFDNTTQNIRWVRQGMVRWHFISKYWTKTYYNTYEEAITPKFLCRILYQKKLGHKKGKWIGKIYSRDLVNNKKARL